MDKFKNKHEAVLALTMEKMYLQSLADNVPPTIVSLHLNILDEIILFIDPEADINALCDEVNEKRHKANDY